MPQKKARKRRNPITSSRQYRLVRAAASGRARGTTMTPAAARKLLRETPVSGRRKLARSKNPGQGQMIPAKVIVGKGGKVRVFVNPKHLRRSNPDILNAIRAGDRVTIVNRFGQTKSGRAVMRGPAGWVLNMGGPHGTPGIATNENIVKVLPKK